MWVCCSSAPRGGAEPLISLPPRRLVAVRWVPPTRWAPHRRLRSRSTTCSSGEAGAGGVGACSVREGDAQRARGSARGGGVAGDVHLQKGSLPWPAAPPPQPPSQTPPSSPCGFAWRPRVGRSASCRLGVCGVGDQSFGRRPDAGVRSENPQTSRQETGAAGESPSFKRQRAPDSARLKPGFSGDRNDRDEGSAHGEGGREAG